MTPVGSYPSNATRTKPDFPAEWPGLVSASMGQIPETANFRNGLCSERSCVELAIDSEMIPKIDNSPESLPVCQWNVLIEVSPLPATSISGCHGRMQSLLTNSL